MTYDENNYQDIEQRLRAVAPAIRPGVRERILDDCTERERSARRARQRRNLALRGAVAWVLVMQCLTVLWLDHQRDALLEPNTRPAAASLLAAMPPSAEFARQNVQARFRTLAVLLTDDEMNVERPSKEARDVHPGNTFPTPVANYSG